MSLSALRLEHFCVHQQKAALYQIATQWWCQTIKNLTNGNTDWFLFNLLFICSTSDADIKPACGKSCSVYRAIVISGYLYVTVAHSPLCTGFTTWWTYLYSVTQWNHQWLLLRADRVQTRIRSKLLFIYFIIIGWLCTFLVWR